MLSFNIGMFKPSIPINILLKMNIIPTGGRMFEGYQVLEDQEFIDHFEEVKNGNNIFIVVPKNDNLKIDKRGIISLIATSEMNLESALTSSEDIIKRYYTGFNVITQTGIRLEFRAPENISYIRTIYPFMDIKVNEFTNRTWYKTPKLDLRIDKKSLYAHFQRMVIPMGKPIVEVVFVPTYNPLVSTPPAVNNFYIIRNSELFADPTPLFGEVDDI